MIIGIKRIAKLLILVLLLNIPAIAQKAVPGYLGKRFSIGTSSLMFPGLRPFPQETRVKYKVRGLNVSQALDLNYVFRYRTVIAASVIYTGRKLEQFEYSTAEQHYVHMETYRLSTFSYSLGIKLFRSTRFAPLGPYMRWEALYGTSSVKYDARLAAPKNYYNAAAVLYPAGVVHIRSFGAAWGIGKQRIFMDKLIVDAGFRIALLVGTQSDTENVVAQEAFVKANESTLGQHFFNVRIGIGFLAF